MDIKTFVENFNSKKFINTKTGIDEKAEYLRKELEIKTYIPFREKRKIVETIVAQNINEVDGIKKYDSINAYIGLITATIIAHTNLEFSSDPVADYDLLAESGLLSQIIAAFQESYNEFDVLLKMAVAAELEDNNINVLVGKFLNGISNKLDSVGETLKSINIKDILGANFKEEDLANLKRLLDTFNK